MMVTDGIPSSMAKNSWNSFGPCCRSSDKEGAHMKRTWKVLLVCVVAVAALAVRSIWKGHKKGGHCGGDCGQCGGCHHK